MAGDNGALIKIDNTLHLYFAMVAVVLPRGEIVYILEWPYTQLMC